MEGSMTSGLWSILKDGHKPELYAKQKEPLELTFHNT